MSVAVSAREQLRRAVRLSPAEINVPRAANQRESLTGVRAVNAQIYDYLTSKEEAAAATKITYTTKRKYGNI